HGLFHKGSRTARRGDTAGTRLPGREVLAEADLVERALFDADVFDVTVGEGDHHAFAVAVHVDQGPFSAILAAGLVVGVGAAAIGGDEDVAEGDVGIVVVVDLPGAGAVPAARRAV